MRYFAIAYAIAIGAAFLPVDPVWLKWIVAAVLIGIYAWYVRGHLREEATNDGEDLAPLRFHRLDRGAHRDDPQHAAPADRQRPGPDGARASSSSGRRSSSGPCRTCRRSSASIRRCWRSSSRRSRPSCPRSSTRSSGSTRTRTRWRWATSPARWSSSRRSRPSSRCVFASDTWVATEGSYVVFASAGIAFLSSAVIFIPMARRGVLHGRLLLVGGAFYVAYLGSSSGSSAAPSAGLREPLIYSGDRYRGCPKHADREVRRKVRRRAVRPPRPDPGLARRPDLLLRG